MDTLKHIIIIYKANHIQAKQTSLEIQTWLHEKNITSVLFSADVLEEELASEITHAQAALILGGDGTFIGSARKFVDTNIPLLGINFGQLGFLLEIAPQNWHQALEQLYLQKLIIKKKPALTWSIMYKKTLFKKGVAINDIVVGRGALARLLPIHLTINNHALGLIRSDGVLIATPIGSSAYTVSAHGPLVHPELSALTVTSISTLSRHIPPLVLPLTSYIELRPIYKNNVEVFLTIDGQEGILLHSGAYVIIESLKNTFLMYTTPNYDYFQQIQNKVLTSS